MPISKDDVQDTIVATIKGAVGATPLVGGLLSEYIGLAQEKIADKRTSEWRQMVETQLQKLSLGFDELVESDFFYSCVQIATVNAMRSYQQEKRQMFANALYNSIELDLEQDKKLFFISLLDQCTLPSIKLLKYFSTNHYSEENNAHRKGMVTTYTQPGTELPIKHILKNNPEFNNDPNFAISLTEQLVKAGLVVPIDFKMPEYPNRTRQKRTTNLGDEFLQFILAS